MRAYVFIHNWKSIRRIHENFLHCTYNSFTKKISNNGKEKKSAGEHCQTRFFCIHPALHLDIYGWHFCDRRGCHDTNLFNSQQGALMCCPVQNHI